LAKVECYMALSNAKGKMVFYNPGLHPGYVNHRKIVLHSEINR
jgi:hypothetical protein